VWFWVFASIENREKILCWLVVAFEIVLGKNEVWRAAGAREVSPFRGGLREIQ
jgi:hypothetical protein